MVARATLIVISRSSFRGNDMQPHPVERTRDKESGPQSALSAMIILPGRSDGSGAAMFNSVACAMAGLTQPSLEMLVRIMIRAVMEHIREDRLLAAAIDHEEARLPIADVIDGSMQQGSTMLTSWRAWTIAGQLGPFLRSFPRSSTSGRTAAQWTWTLPRKKRCAPSLAISPGRRKAGRWFRAS